MVKKANNTYPSFFSFNLAEDFTNFDWAPGFEPFIAQNRKNIESIGTAHKITLDNWKNIAKRQSEFLSEMIKDQSTLIKELMTEGTPEQKITRQAGLAKKTYERSFDNLQEIGAMISAMNEDIAKVVTDHVQESIATIGYPLNKKAA